MGDEKNMLEGLKIGADDYRAKSFSINLLRASINWLIAARILKESEHSITEIADMTGFCDAKCFRDVFRKHFGVSLSEYRGKGMA